MTEERKVTEFMMEESLAQMKVYTFQNRHKKTWYDKACEFLATIENRLKVICDEDFNSAINYFLDFLLPQAS